MAIEDPCEASTSGSSGGGNGQLMKQRAGLRRLSARANAERSSSILASALAAASSASSSSSSLGASSSSGEAAAAISSPTKSVVFSFSRLGHELANHLRACGVPLGPGLSATELERIEALLGFAFPPDVRGLLEAAVPYGPGFPDWRSSSSASQLRAWMDLPTACVCAAVDATEFWCVKAFGGPRPSSPSAAVAACLAAMRRRFPAPMVPIFGGFFIPSLPSRAGNPVFYFDQQGRLACCGGSLEELVRRGFSPGEAWPRPEPAVECGSNEDDDDDDDDPFRRWSTSDLLRSRSMGMEERSRSLPGRLQKGEGDGSWGRKLDALASTALSQLKKSAPPPETMATGGNARPLDPMPSSLSRVIQNLLTSSRKDAVGSPRRRIEFWSDVVDRMVLFHQQRTWVGDEDLALSLSWCLSPRQQQRQHHSRAASISMTDSTPMKDEVADGGGGDGDGRKWVSTVLGDVAARLRRGGWKEEEILEMVEASSPRSVLGQHQEASRDSSSTEFLHLVVDTKMLQKAGFSAEELGSLVLVD